MNISPILLLSIGCSFALLYGLIITLGWSITRRNRKRYHRLVGVTEIELFDLNSWKALSQYSKSVSLTNNFFQDEKDQRIETENYNCFLVAKEAPAYPNIKKGFLIFINKQTKKLEYAFDIPNLENYR